jgi:hypothetical protein
VLRSDSSPTVHCFNKLASKDPAMSKIADLWEDVQFHFGFEGLLVHCKGITNEMADRASQLPESELQTRLADNEQGSSSSNRRTGSRLVSDRQGGEKGCIIRAEQKRRQRQCIVARSNQRWWSCCYKAT